MKEMPVQSYEIVEKILIKPLLIDLVHELWVYLSHHFEAVLEVEADCRLRWYFLEIIWEDLLALIMDKMKVYF